MNNSSSDDLLQATIARRSLLAGTAALLLAGCSAPTKELPRTAATVASLTADLPFYVAHRGGGDNWPEMTAYAYAQAAALPWVKAMEVSVHRSLDGVLVCSHDATTARLTGVNYTIEKQTWANLSRLQVSPTWTSDPTQPKRPLATLDEIVDTYVDRFVMFVEPKDNSAAEDVMDKLTSLDNPERIVWKQPINQPNFGAAKEAGFTTWGYVLREPGHLGDNLTRYAASKDIDFLGAPRYENDEFISTVARAAEANGKKTIAWPIRTAEDRTRVMQLGCAGMMTSNIAEVPEVPLP